MGCKMKTLVIFDFETGDTSCPDWYEIVVVDGEFSVAEIKKNFLSYCESNLSDDEQFDEIVKGVMSATGLKWSFVNGKTPELDAVAIVKI